MSAAVKRKCLKGLTKHRLIFRHTDRKKIKLKFYCLFCEKRFEFYRQTVYYSLQQPSEMNKARIY